MPTVIYNCPVGRLLYTTGDVGGAVRLFLNLLRGAPDFINAGLPLHNDGTAKAGGNDKVYLDDFKVAYQVSRHLRINPMPIHNLLRLFTVLEVNRTRRS